MKIRQRFLAMFVAAALLPVLIAGGVAFLLVREITYDRAAGLLDAFAATQESRIDRILEENQERLTSFATRGDVRDLLAQAETLEGEQLAAARSRMTAIIFDVLNSNEAFRQVEVVDAKGQVFASTVNSRVGLHATDMTTVMAGRNGPSVSDMYLDASGQERFRLSGPVFSGGKYVGSALIETDTLNLLSVAGDYRALGRTGETIIARQGADGSAEVIVPLRTDPSSALRLAIPTTPRVPIIEALARREETFRNVPDYQGSRVFAATRYIERAGYAVAVKMNVEEIEEPLVPLRRLLWEAILAALFVAVVLAAYAANRLSEPLSHLTSVARRIAEGNEGTRVDVRGDDETADLARSFNIMVSKLLAERLRLEAAVKSLPVGVLVVGQNDEIVLRNDHAAHILGLPVQQPYGLQDVIGMLPASMRAQSKFRECVTQGKVIELKEEFIGDRAVRMLLSPVRARAAGSSHGFVLLLEDVSEARKLERAKNDFVSVASHQLRTPLTAIKGIVSMMIDHDLGPLTKQQEPFMAEMQHSTDRMIELVNALLNASRIDLGIFSVEPEPVDLAELSKSVADEMSLTMQKKKMHFEMNVDTSMGLVMVDPKLMRMIFQNLLSNAVKYTGVGGYIKLTAKREAGRIKIRVADNGYGIPEKQRDKIFTKMFRADNARQLDPDGTGLGLYIVKAIAEATGGEIHFESTEGRGTTFTVTLPQDGMKRKQGSKDLEP